MKTLKRGNRRAQAQHHALHRLRLDRSQHRSTPHDLRSGVIGRNGSWTILQVGEHYVCACFFDERFMGKARDCLPEVGSRSGKRYYRRLYWKRTRKGIRVMLAAFEEPAPTRHRHCERWRWS